MKGAAMDANRKRKAPVWQDKGLDTANYRETINEVGKGLQHDDGQFGHAPLITAKNGPDLLACPKWNACNAPVCPLDREWRLRTHLDSDSVCFFLTEHVKTDSEAVFRGLGRGFLYGVIAEVIPVIRQRHRRINRKLQESAKTASRMTKTIGLKGGGV